MFPAQGFKKTYKHNISKRLYHGYQVTSSFQVTSSLKGNRQWLRSGTVPGGTGALLLWKPQTSPWPSSATSCPHGTHLLVKSQTKRAVQLCAPLLLRPSQDCFLYPMDGWAWYSYCPPSFSQDTPVPLKLGESQYSPLDATFPLPCFSLLPSKNLGPLLPQGLPYLASSVIDPACHISLSWHLLLHLQ